MENAPTHTHLNIFTPKTHLTGCKLFTPWGVKISLRGTKPPLHPLYSIPIYVRVSFFNVSSIRSGKAHLLDRYIFFLYSGGELTLQLRHAPEQLVGPRSTQLLARPGELDDQSRAHRLAVRVRPL